MHASSAGGGGLARRADVLDDGAGYDELVGREFGFFVLGLLDEVFEDGVLHVVSMGQWLFLSSGEGRGKGGVPEVQRTMMLVFQLWTKVWSYLSAEPKAASTAWGLG